MKRLLLFLSFVGIALCGCTTVKEIHRDASIDWYDFKLTIKEGIAP